MRYARFFVYSYDNFTHRYEGCPFGYYTLAGAQEYAAELREKLPSISVIVLPY